MLGAIPSLPYMLPIPLDNKERHLFLITPVPAHSPICNDAVLIEWHSAGSAH